MTDAVPVSVIIVTYNGKENLARCVDSVLRQPYRPVEIVIVDNGSTDGTEELLASRYPSLRVIRNTSNRGFAGGNNQGVAAAGSDFCILLNDDTEVEAGWIPGLLAGFERPGTGAVTSRVVTDGVPAEFYEKNGSLNYLGYNIMRVFSDLSKVFFAGGASLMFRKSDVGLPFRDEYFIYHEDVYLSWQLRLRGFEVRMAQESVVSHRGAVTARKHPSAVVTFYQVRNRLLNVFFFYERRTLFWLLPLLLADAAATLGHGVVSGRRSGRGIVKAWFWIGTHVRWILEERRSVQSARVIADREFMSLMSSRVLDSEGAAASALNRMSRWYAGIAGLAHHG